MSSDMNVLRNFPKNSIEPKLDSGSAFQSTPKKDRPLRPKAIEHPENPGYVGHFVRSSQCSRRC